MYTKAHMTVRDFGDGGLLHSRQTDHLCAAQTCTPLRAFFYSLLQFSGASVVQLLFSPFAFSLASTAATPTL
jgi:hypothetical protein